MDIWFIDARPSLCNFINCRGKLNYPGKATPFNNARFREESNWWLALDRIIITYGIISRRRRKAENTHARHPSHNKSTMTRVDSRRSGEVAIHWPQCQNYQRGRFLAFLLKTEVLFFDGSRSTFSLTPFIDKSRNVLNVTRGRYNFSQMSDSRDTIQSIALDDWNKQIKIMIIIIISDVLIKIC